MTQIKGETAVASEAWPYVRPVMPTTRDETMRRNMASAQRLLMVGLVLCVLGSSSMAVGLLLLAGSLEVGAGTFFVYLIASSAMSVGGVVAMLVAFVLE